MKDGSLTNGCHWPPIIVKFACTEERTKWINRDKAKVSIS